MSSDAKASADINNAQRASCWSVTINNPTPEDWGCMKNPTGSKDFISCSGQLEEGENGTPHLQLIFKCKSMKRSAVKKLFPRAHLEVARDPTALETYCHKAETRVAAIAPTIVATVTTLTQTISEVFESEKQVDEYIATLSDDDYQRAGICVLDKIAVHLIRKGYHGVEYIASNPSVRSAWKLYYKHMVYRQYATQDESQDATPQQEAQSEEQASLHESDG